MTMVRFKVKFGNGMPEDAEWILLSRSGWLDFGEDKFRIASHEVPISTPFSTDPAEDDGSSRTRNASGPKVNTYNLADLRFLAYEDAGTKSNIGALAVFGALGLGARKSWTLITVGFPDRDAQFLVRAPLHEVRGLLQQAEASSPSLGSLVLEGSPPSVQPKTTPQNGESSGSALDEMERLAKLYQEGLLTGDEFSRMKAKLLDEE